MVSSNLGNQQVTKTVNLTKIPPKKSMVSLVCSSTFCQNIGLGLKKYTNSKLKGCSLICTFVDICNMFHTCVPDHDTVWMQKSPSGCKKGHDPTVRSAGMAAMRV